ncbi:helix-turn-helix transcriptional regulator [Bacteroides caecigallinarum]|uniref:helix-turn-helix domain-containing protein n=1 Tax=Bacteroides caecigallinarum TaxID=1411144 RepID=UPI0019577923|nr:AraC family transcriptional regulator [Bacteroides caecigallinarum]MBM6864007.1 helix-turn-helix transcriptional regulator [Bacteroides caecigallinarum]MBU3806825.1 AraC family transcriptional regulator [Candidatus Phocaeicola faecipullorum]
MEQEVIKVDSIEKFNDIFGFETIHPMVGIIDFSKATRWPETLKINYGVYAVYLKKTKCGDITYGRQSYDYEEGTIVSFAPGQVVTSHMTTENPPQGYGILFHPDYIHGTSLGKAIKKYSFFSYDAREALHLSDGEKKIIVECMTNIEQELKHRNDKHSKTIITANIGLILDYCMRFYERQFDTREKVNKDIIVRFEQLLEEYFDSKAPIEKGLPTVRYFAERVFLSPNYFGDMISRQTGKTASEYIHTKVVDKAKEELLSTQKTMTEIAYSLGFQYPQHLSRMFKKEVGCTPNEYRTHMA